MNKKIKQTHKETMDIYDEMKRIQSENNRITEKTKKIKKDVTQMLAKGEITEAEYDAVIEALEGK